MNNAFCISNPSTISDQSLSNAITRVFKKSNINDKILERGVKQVAQLWQSSDGSAEDFINFCETYTCVDKTEKLKLFKRLESHFETIFGLNNMMTSQLLRPVQVIGSEPLAVDDIFSAYNPMANFNDDMFKNKIAFIVVLNFPYFSLQEKVQNGKNWTPEEWGFVRLGDIFTSRIQADINQEINNALTAADTYISNYNIPMGKIVGDQFVQYWPSDLKLISHWGLRDEIKANYADKQNGLAKQILIFNVMRRIIDQKTPVEVFEQNSYRWYPPSNGIYLKDIEVVGTPEKNQRYQVLLNNFKAVRMADPFYPNYKNFIDRKFEGEYEISVQDCEKMFTTLLSSMNVMEVSKIISKRLGRKLQPFDIWYDGFKNRSTLDPNLLDSLTKAKYPNIAAFQKDLPNILIQLGFTPARANEICSMVHVDPSVGAGHALGALMKTDKALLRTRFTPSGMDYKGYNIGVHEFGHNVEQTISLHNVPNYFLNGVPNTAFTEAVAFTFQSKDLELLGIKNDDPLAEDLATVDLFWSCYEIMGVSLVDIKVWNWMYENPNCTADQLQNAVISIAKEVWNQYYAPVFGIQDQTILAIYSHMIDAPLYLSAYPIGHVIDFQLGQYLKGKNIATEIERMYAIGRVTPNLWMQRAVGADVSVEPLLKATETAITNIKNADKNSKKNSKKGK
jgi:hypothetical protein